MEPSLVSAPGSFSETPLQLIFFFFVNPGVLILKFFIFYLFFYIFVHKHTCSLHLQPRGGVSVIKVSRLKHTKKRTFSVNVKKKKATSETFMFVVTTDSS